MSSRLHYKQTRISKSGQLTIPDEFRDELGLVPGAAVTFVRVGTSLLVLPENTEFEAIADRMADFFESVGVEPKDVIAELSRIREQEFVRRFPDLADRE